jgi:hypothetical protein
MRIDAAKPIRHYIDGTAESLMGRPYGGTHKKPFQEVAFETTTDIHLAWHSLQQTESPTFASGISVHRRQGQLVLGGNICTKIQTLAEVNIDLS